MKAVTKSSLEWKEYATNKSADLLDSWDQEEAFRVVEQLARTGFFESKKFGVYRHGGTVGWLSGLVEFPELSKVLARIVLEINPVAAFTSVMVSYNAPRAMHKDFNNDYQTQNYVVPIQCPDQGGELWVELKPGDVVMRINPRYFRPAEVETLLGDPSKAKQKLGWVPELTVQDMCAEMVSEDLKTAQRHALLKQHGYDLPVSLENG